MYYLLIGPVPHLLRLLADVWCNLKARESTCELGDFPTCIVTHNALPARCIVCRCFDSVTLLRRDQVKHRIGIWGRSHQHVSGDSTPSSRNKHCRINVRSSTLVRRDGPPHPAQSRTSKLAYTSSLSLLAWSPTKAPISLQIIHPRLAR